MTFCSLSERVAQAWFLCGFGNSSQEILKDVCIIFVSQVISYLEKKFAELESPNKMKVYMGHGAKAWVSDFNHPHYMAGRKAMKTGELVLFEPKVITVTKKGERDL